MEKIKKFIEQRILESVNELNLQKALEETISKIGYSDIYKQYIKNLEREIRKKISNDNLEQDTIKKLEENSNNKGYYYLEKEMTRTYLKNGYSILDFDSKIKAVKDCEIDISLKFGYEKENTYYGDIDKIIEKLQDNFIKSKSFDMHKKDENFQLSDRFHQCFYMTVIEKENEPYIEKTIAKKCEFIDKNTGETLNGIEISTPLIEAKKGEVIRVIQSFTMPNSLFSKTPFPDKVKFNTPVAYTKIKVQEEIYGNPIKKKIIPTLKIADGKTADPISKDFNLYYYYYSWEFFYNPLSNDEYELHVVVQD